MKILTEKEFDYREGLSKTSVTADKYYLFENGNRYSKSKYTKEQAIKAFLSLKNCKYCVNCEDCVNCENCINRVNKSNEKNIFEFFKIINKGV